MKNKKLELGIEQAIRLYSNASPEMKEIFEATFGKDFHKVDITDKVYDLDTLIEYLGYDPRPMKVLSTHSEKEQQFGNYINACAIIKNVVELYNEGTVLDWKNSNQYKWRPYKYFSGGSWVVDFYYYYCRLCGSVFEFYKSKELSEKGYNNFKSFYEDFWNHK